MAKRTQKNFFSPKTIIISLIILGGIVYSLYRVVPRSLQPVDIFVVTDPLEYGETSLTGVLSKDTAVGEVGNYYLNLTDGRSVILDVQGMDDFLGLTFTASGFLNPPNSNSILPFMSVTSMEGKQ